MRGLESWFLGGVVAFGLFPFLACESAIDAPTSAAGKRELGPGTSKTQEPSPGGGLGGTDEFVRQAVRFSCTPGRDPSPSPLRRMSKIQYTNAVASVIRVLPSAEAQSIIGRVQEHIDQVPNDSRESFRRADSDVSQDHVGAYHRVAVAVATEMTRSAERLARVAGSCAVPGHRDVACIQKFVSDFGLRLFRRPLTSAESAFYENDIYLDKDEITMDGFKDVISAMLMAPQFLYILEIGGEAIDGREDLTALTDYELATRLSFHFWRDLPDEALLDAAKRGDLQTEEGYKKEVERLFNDPKTAASVDVFFEEWLRLDKIPELHTVVGTTRYDQFAGEDAATAELRGNMIREVLDLIQHHVWTTNGSWKDVFLSELSFARTADLAQIYGVPQWDGQGDPPRFQEGTRSGLLTRAAFLATGTARTRPIYKGELIRRAILCDELPDPPADVGEPPDLSRPLSTRALVEELTEKPGSSCLSCHQMLNPLGFATEHYDALGRIRDTQTLYSDDGAEPVTVDISSQTVPRVDSNDSRVAQNGLDLNRFVSESEKVEACMVRNYFRYVYARREDLAADGCTLERLREKISEGGSLRDMLKEVAFQPEFRTKMHPDG